MCEGADVYSKKEKCLQGHFSNDKPGQYPPLAAEDAVGVVPGRSPGVLIPSLYTAGRRKSTIL